MVQAELVSVIASGDLRRAASSLVVDHSADVFATCLAIVRDRSAAEDLTQDVFSDAIRGLSSFRGESAPRTWLLSIARHRCIDYLRAKKRDPSRDLWAGTLVDDDARDPDAHPDQAANGPEWLADRDEVNLALETLPEGDRALVVLRFKNGLEYDELAAAFGLRTGTVRMRVSRALARMREALEPQLHRARASRAMPPAPGAPSPPFTAAPAARAAAPAPAAAAPPSSWWQRIVAWARGSTTPPPSPIGDVGRTLGRIEPSFPSDKLVARLEALVARLPDAID